MPAIARATRRVSCPAHRARFLSLLALGATLTALARPAGADQSRVALIDVDPTLRSAAEVVLEPWNIQLVGLDDQAAPGASMPSAARLARDIARANGVSAVVWISQTDTRSALWVYDTDSDKVFALGLPAPPPYDEPTAAGVALTIKTLLRHSAVAPLSERRVIEPPPAPAPVKNVFVELWTAGRLRQGITAIETRVGAQAWWFPGRAGRFGLGVKLRTGPGLPVDHPEFVGRYRATTISLAATARLPVSRAVSIELAGGSSLHSTELDGLPVGTNLRTARQRFNPSADASVKLDVEIVRDLWLGAIAEGAYMMRRQRYLVGPIEVLDLPAIELELGVLLRVPMR